MIKALEYSDWTTYSPVEKITCKAFCEKYAKEVTAVKKSIVVADNHSKKYRPNYKRTTAIPLVAYFRIQESPVIVLVPDNDHLKFLLYWNLPLRWYKIQKKYLTKKYVQIFTRNMS